MNPLNLKDKRFGRLVALYPLADRVNGRVVWRCQCDCGNKIDVPSTYLTSGDTTSCGCLKKDIDPVNLRDRYDDKRIDGVVKPLFKGKKPRKDSTIGYRGVRKYYTRVTHEQRYRAWLTVKGKQYYKSGFKTAEDAYYHGRLELERRYLPFDPDKENGKKD